MFKIPRVRGSESPHHRSEVPCKRVGRLNSVKGDFPVSFPSPWLHTAETVISRKIVTNLASIELHFETVALAAKHGLNTVQNCMVKDVMWISFENKVHFSYFSPFSWF